jgi:phosphopantetheinyl transferase
LFSPKLMECNTQKFSNESEFISGVVSVEDKCYQTFSLRKESLIHTTAICRGVAVEHNYFEIVSESSEGQSIQVRNEVCQTISGHLGYSLSSVKIENNNYGVPEVIVNGFNSKIQLSISHHGRYGAYAICYEHYKND